MPEEKIQNAIREKTYKFDVDSAKVGQINGLAVYNLGDYSFGKPTRITVSTYIGNRGIINIEREVPMNALRAVLLLSLFLSPTAAAVVRTSISTRSPHSEQANSTRGIIALC